MTREDLARKVAVNLDTTIDQASEAVRLVFVTIASQLQAGEGIVLRGFGRFHIRKKDPREARNPKTGEPVLIPSRKVVIFKPGVNLKDATRCQWRP